MSKSPLLKIISILMCVFTCLWLQLAHSGQPMPGQALDTVVITIVGDKNDALAVTLYKTAKKFAPKSAIIEWQSNRKGEKGKYPSLEKPAAYVCIISRCSLPAFTPESLKQMLGISATDSSEIFMQNIKAESNDHNSFNDLLRTNNIWMIAPVFWFFGLLLSISPCLLPLMLIITSIIGGSVGSISKSKAITLSLTYILALSCTYTVAGIAAASFGLYLQGIMQNSWVIAGFSALFILLAISLFGFINFQLPNKWRKSLSLYSHTFGAGSYLGVAIMGILATLIASPCIAAPLAGILAYIAESGNIQLGAIALFSTGLGIGTPVLLVVTIGIELLQKIGSWQKYIKQLFGIILLGIAIWLLSRVLSPKAIMLLWSGLIIFTAMNLGVLDTKPTMISSADNRINKEFSRLLFSIRKTIGIILLIYGGAILVAALIGNTNPLSPFDNKSLFSSPAAIQDKLYFTEIKSMPELNAAVTSDKTSNKVILVMFTAEWCAVCKNIEKNVFENEYIKNKLQQFMLIKIDLTNNDSHALEAARHYSISGPPVILFYLNGSLLKQRINGDIESADFITLINGINNKPAVQ